MEKIHTIEFTTDGDVKELKKKVNDCIDKAYASDAVEDAENDLFIVHIANLTKLSFRLSDKGNGMVDDWKEAMLLKGRGDKRSFRCSYARAFSEIASDIVELAKDHRDATNPDREEARD